MTSRNLSDSDVHPFYWECVECQKAYVLSEFVDYSHIYNYLTDLSTIDELRQVPFFNERIIEKIKNMFKGDSFGIFSTVSGRCSNLKCKNDAEVVLWIEIGVVEKRGDDELLFEISEIVIIDVSTFRLVANPGFYRGVDIAEGLHKLYMRWWYLGGEICIVCPFIGKKELQYFQRIGSSIIKTINFKNRNPFRKIITRLNNWDTKLKKYTFISDKVKEYISENDDSLPMSLNHQRSALGFVFNGTLSGVKCFSKPNASGNDGFLYANYFHGKMYGCKLPWNAEMVITSYNYIDREVMQLESLAFIETTKENFDHQMVRLELDPHMEIIPIKI